MSLLQKIPILPELSDQSVTVELDSNPYEIRVLWNERFEYFSLSVTSVTGEPILKNIKMVKNYPLTTRYKNTLLPFGSFYFVQEKGKSDKASFEDLGTNYGLYYFEADPVALPQPLRQRVFEALLGSDWDSNFTEWDEGSTVWDE